MGLYDSYLALRTRLDDATPPRHVALAITERDLLRRGAYETLSRFYRWTFEYGAERLSVYVSVLDPEAAPTLREEIAAVDAPRPVAVRGPDDDRRADAPIQVSLGLGGKHEFTAAVRAIAEGVERGEIAPAEVDADAVESRLVFSDEPDLVIKTGAERLSDFMIWQSVYSELYFTDVNWQNLRERDYLRAVREYQERSRRFGR